MLYRLDEFEDGKINPITKKKFDSSWMIMRLSESEAYHCLVGNNFGSAYTIVVSKVVHKNWKLAVGDFIDYCNVNDLNGILVISESEYEEVVENYKGHSFDERTLRDYETPVLIHSTSLEAWTQIQRDGMLKCFNRLRAENVICEETPIGALLGDPEHFSDYIMFGGGRGGEIVLSSKQKGEIVMDPDAEYTTGARLYFDAEKIARDGLIVRDGFHIKVKDSLPLEPYLIWTATWETVGLESQISTPRIFSEKADEVFNKIMKERLF